MRDQGRRIQRAAFGMGILAAMGFGAVQATAAPQRSAAAERSCTLAQYQACQTLCAGADAICRNGSCICI